MRVFLCAFTGFSVAIPMSSVSSITLCADEATQTTEYNQVNRNTYVSLPRLFNRPMENIRHGIILKNSDDEDSDAEDYNIIENKTILLTTEIEGEAEIPDEAIYPIPKVFNGMRFSALFSGFQFDSRAVPDTANTVGSPVLLLNPGQLLESVQKEQAS